MLRCAWNHSSRAPTDDNGEGMAHAICPAVALAKVQVAIGLRGTVDEGCPREPAHAGCVSASQSSFLPAHGLNSVPLLPAYAKHVRPACSLLERVCKPSHERESGSHPAVDLEMEGP